MDQAPGRSPAADPRDRRIRRTWWFLASSFFVLGFLTLLRLLAGSPRTLDWILAGLVVIAGLAVVLHRREVETRETGRRAETETFARILQGLSRSVSPDAIVDAIVEELTVGAGADHTVVVRLRPDARVLEATLVSSRAGVPDSTTILPVTDLEDPLREPILTRRRRIGIAIDGGSLSGQGELAAIGSAAGSGIASGVAGAGLALATSGSAESTQAVATLTAIGIPERPGSRPPVVPLADRRTALPDRRQAPAIRRGRRV
ncbi:MAG TPA: hypothetical protein VK656_04240, partial [Candidatus Acidoferrum sp.]|nr:hypothetical protein [Candidatus Acidoferrum sp.]